MKLLIVFLFGMNLYASEGGMKGTSASAGAGLSGKDKSRIKPEVFAQKKKMALERVEQRVKGLTQTKSCINAAADMNALHECRKKSKIMRKEMKETNKAENKKLKNLRKAKREEWKGRRDQIKSDIKAKKEELKNKE